MEKKTIIYKDKCTSAITSKANHIIVGFSCKYVIEFKMRVRVVLLKMVSNQRVYISFHQRVVYCDK